MIITINLISMERICHQWDMFIFWLRFGTFVFVAANNPNHRPQNGVIKPTSFHSSDMTWPYNKNFILIDKHIVNTWKPNKKKYRWFLTNPSENLTNIILVVSQPSIHPPAQASSPATNLWPRFPGEVPGRSRNSSRSPPPRSNARDGKMCHLRISIWWCTIIKKIYVYIW